MAALSYRLAVKFVPEKAQMLKADADLAFQLAALTDQTNVTLRFQPDFTNYM